MTTLSSRADERLSRLVGDCAREKGLENVFNPSVLFKGDSTLVTFRARLAGTSGPFLSFLLRRSANGGEVVNLSAMAQAEGHLVFADPKLVLLGEEVYVTGNTGFVQSGRNEILLASVTPTVGRFQKCVVPNRQPVEKNWGFFLAPDGNLAAIYSLNPVQLLTLAHGELGNSAVLRFSHDEHSPITSSGVSIAQGTQPLMVSRSTALLVAHEKRTVRGRRIYVGRLAEVDLESATVAFLGRRLVHSYRSMLPVSSRRPNRNLFSATYFSGLQFSEKSLVLSYGVNDASYGIARIDDPRSAGDA